MSAFDRLWVDTSIHRKKKLTFEAFLAQWQLTGALLTESVLGSNDGFGRCTVGG